MSRIWYKADMFEPVNRPIIYFTKNGKAGTLSRIDRWKRYREKYAIEYWAYQSEVLLSVKGF